MSTLDEIKSRIDIVDLVSEAGVKLRHAGKNYTGFVRSTITSTRLLLWSGPSLARGAALVNAMKAATSSSS
jgi:hypothetical protein